MLIDEQDAIMLARGARAISKLLPPSVPKPPWSVGERHAMVVDGRPGNMGAWVIVSVEPEPYEARLNGPRAEALAKGEGYSSAAAWAAAMTRKYKTIPKGAMVVRIGLAPEAVDRAPASPADPSVLTPDAAYAVGHSEIEASD